MSATKQGRVFTIDAPSSPFRRGHSPSGFTLVEMLVVVLIIGIVIALLLPAIGAARASARRAACQSNLRQFGIALSKHAESAPNGAYCTGAFDWQRDGAVTEFGWVADLVKLNVPAGEMLCPSNPSRAPVTFEQLLTSTDGDACNIPRVGSPPRTLPDGTMTAAPCYQMLTDPASYDPGDPAGLLARIALIKADILEQGYNTNYVPSWFLVRSEVMIEEEGDGAEPFDGDHDDAWEDANPGDLSCTRGNLWRNSTAGPLTQARLDTAQYPSSMVPLAGDGAATSTVLSADIGDLRAGTSLVASMTRGPLRKSIAGMSEVDFTVDTAKSGASGWYSVWNRALQDYSQFGAVHNGRLNVLFADGSVRTFKDRNDDGFLNNGFDAVGPFASDEVELENSDIVSRWSLHAPRLSGAP